MGPRLVMVVGSGEMSPRMAPVHRAVVQRLAAGLGRDVAGVMLDTPYGFQENADEITDRTIRYFRDRVGLQLEHVPLPRSGDAGADTAATEAVRAADFVFAGPGSPSYALAQWRDSGIASALREKLERGGAISFASAAAITMGVAALPVYEIYKAGHDPHWLAGLDLLGVAGLRVAVVPHFDNREGRAHDTRFCYVGERRFRALETELPRGVSVLGVDENTALVLDLESGLGEVRGPGAVTIRAGGASRELRAGLRFALDELVPMPEGAAARRVAVGPGPSGSEPLETRLAAALQAGDGAAALGAVLEMERLARGTDRAAERARLALRSALVVLTEHAGRASAEKKRVARVIDALVAARGSARTGGDWATADEIRKALARAGVSLRDTPEGPVWDRVSARRAPSVSQRGAGERASRS